MTDLKQATKTIDGITFRLYPVGAWESYPLFHGLMTILGPMASLISEAISKGGKDKKISIADVNLNQFFDILPATLAKADPVEFRKLVTMMLEGCTYRPAPVKGKQQEDMDLIATFDEAMRGKLLTVFKLAAWAIQVNFADFFSGAQLAIAARNAAASKEALANSSNSESSEAAPPAEA